MNMEVRNHVSSCEIDDLCVHTSAALCDFVLRVPASSSLPSDLCGASEVVTLTHVISLVLVRDQKDGSKSEDG